MHSAVFDTLALDIERMSRKHLDELCRGIWAALADGKLSEDEAQSLDEMARDRRRPPPQAIPVPPPRPKPRPRSPDRQRSLERRRRLSAAGMMPPALACRFTVGERAALYVVATEASRRGRCDLYVDQIAAFAGVSRSTAKNAIRVAKRLGMIKVEPWKMVADWNGPSRIRIVDKAWLAWLAQGRQKMTVKNLTTTLKPDSERAVKQRKMGHAAESFANAGTRARSQRPQEGAPEPVRNHKGHGADRRT
jgi:hypothetical protein